MKKWLYALCQCLWGLPQTLLGLFHFLAYLRSPHFWYHGALITLWPNKASVSLGLFVFVTDDPAFYPKLQPLMTREEASARLLVHEYGHTVQSLILGPLYLLVIGIPSTVWGFCPMLVRKRQRQQLSYFDFFTESWANRLGERVTHEPSMERLIID